MDRKERTGHGHPGGSAEPASGWEGELTNQVVRAGLTERQGVEQSGRRRGSLPSRCHEEEYSRLAKQLEPSP